MRNASNKQIAEAIYEATKGKAGTHLTDSLINVTKFLARNRLLGKSSEILELLRKKIAKEENKIFARVTSVKKLSSDTKEELVSQLKKKYHAEDVMLEEKLDERLIGGMKIEVEDEVTDLSIRNKIGQLEEYLTRA